MEDAETNEDPGQAYHPNVAIPTGSGLVCFISQDRDCGPACMAYLAQPPPGEQYKGEQWAHCLLLVNAERAGRHLVILASSVGSLMKLNRQKAAEADRTKPAPGVT